MNRTGPFSVEFASKSVNVELLGLPVFLHRRFLATSNVSESRSIDILIGCLDLFKEMSFLFTIFFIRLWNRIMENLPNPLQSITDFVAIRVTYLRFGAEIVIHIFHLMASATAYNSFFSSEISQFADFECCALCTRSKNWEDLSPTIVIYVRLW